MRNVRIGSFSANVELSLCESDLEINAPTQRFFNVWYYNGDVCNSQLEKMWNRVLKIWPSDLSFQITQMNSLLPDGGLYSIPGITDRDVNNVYERVAPHLSFTEEEESVGRKKIESMGIPSGSSIICFIGRDTKFLQQTCPTTNFNYLDFRNMAVKNFLLAAEDLVNRGYFMVRMGSLVSESLGSKNPMIIDYATNGQRTDFMDIYLCAHCQFFISVGTGLDNVCATFRKPILYVNQVPLEYVASWDKRSLFIPKKYWLTNEQRYMTFREIFESGAGRIFSTTEFIDRGIILVENTPEEIRDVTIEMEQRLNGTWVPAEDDEKLQKQFWNLFRPSILHGKIFSRIGAVFLRNNRSLLD